MRFRQKNTSRSFIDVHFLIATGASIPNKRHIELRISRIAAIGWLQSVSDKMIIT